MDLVDGLLVGKRRSIACFNGLKEIFPTVKIAKGIKKSVARTGLHFLHYKECLFHRVAAPKLYVPALASSVHSIYMIDRSKVTLSAYDDKRFVLGDAVQTLAYGHYQISTVNEHTDKRHKA